DLTLDMDEFRRVMEEEERVRLVTITHASNVTGTITPVAEIAKICHEHGALFLVDGAQSVPRMPVDVEALGVDFLAFSGHKMFGPTGTGVLWMREPILEPLILGGGMVESVSDDGYVPASGYARYEAGTQNISGGIGLGAAVDYLNTIGMASVAQRERELTDLLVDGLAKIPGVTLYACADPKARIGAVSFTVEGFEPHEVAAWLDEEHAIAVRSGMHCAEPLMRRLGAAHGTVRASLAFYNTESEVNTLVSVIRELLA
ncbi:MAG: aminotransferase class V-fold PLP-dependent enzyme, partial [Methanocorpusculum sp.]|nr:aminotransferase class V-fold PLP-dependent enzyme [Methanocorpusculum sp.]